MKNSKIKKINPNDDLVTIEYTFSDKKRYSKTMTTIILPKELAALVKEK